MCSFVSFSMVHAVDDGEVGVRRPGPRSMHALGAGLEVELRLFRLAVKMPVHSNDDVDVHAHPQRQLRPGS